MEAFKLYSLVWVAEPSDFVADERVRYIGQILSRRTPEDTYMVRRVPGHPGTLEEMPARWLEPAPTGYTHVSYAKVAGYGSFPVDMLRHDACAPVNFRLVDSEQGPKAVLLPGMGDELMVAKAYGLHYPARWTPGRWLSFIWGIRVVAEMSIED